MAQQQQTVLRVKTNIPNDNIILGFDYIQKDINTTGFGSVIGSGVVNNPFIITQGPMGSFYNVGFFVTEDTTIYISASGDTGASIIKPDGSGPVLISITGGTASNIYSASKNDFISFGFGSGGKAELYNIPPNEPTYSEDLDLYSDIPIKINKSFAELQDISKRNSEYSIGLSLPGSKKNNTFFEGFFNVDNDTLYFNPSKRVPCQVLLNDQSYFTGYMKLNKVSVLNSKIEYDITLFSSVADLFGKIGNNLLKDLDYTGTLNTGLTFNHTFSYTGVSSWNYNIYTNDDIPNYFYPVTHNGYNYTGTSNNDVIVNVSGTTQDSTRLYTTTLASGYTTTAAAYAAGVQRYRINSPQDGIYDNQLKPALSVKKLIELIFQTYGYRISSDFFNTPWFKLLYVYGYFSDDKTKFSFKLPAQEVLPVSGIDINLTRSSSTQLQIIPVKKGTGIPVKPATDIIVGVIFQFTFYPFTQIFNNFKVGAQTTGLTVNHGSTIYPVNLTTATRQVVQLSTKPLAYLPQPPNTLISIVDGTSVNFSQIISQDIKQIDFLSSIAKKFNLVFIPNPEDPFEIIIEPYQYYIGTGSIYDWTDKLSYDKGFTVEPALNYVESELFMTDLEDGDAGNKIFKDRNARLYGQNRIYNPTDFKSDVKKIDTIFSPEVIRTWDTTGTTNNAAVKLPLGINYSDSTETITVGNSEKVVPTYKGTRTKPKLIYYMGNQNPFMDTRNEIIPLTGLTTTKFRILSSDGTSVSERNLAPVISHTIPIGNPDSNKLNNDSICNLFNSEQPTDLGVQTYNVYTDQDIYNLFYQNRITNVFDKDTRFISGYFELKLSDILNLSQKDLIKINEQYFTWNKIDGFNLTNRELTKVELIQVNNVVSEYPTRYFQYYYCDNQSTIYRFKTDFTNPSLSGTSFGWSVQYDYNVGILGGNVTGYTSAILDRQSSVLKYIPYYIYEVEKEDYETSGLDRDPNDSLWMFCVYTGFSGINGDLNIQNFPASVNNSGSTKTITNVFTGCTDFSTIASANQVLTGSSTFHGTNPPVSPYTTGITINITDTGWIKYDTASGTIYTYFGSLGNADIPDCADCSTIREAYPFADLASWTVVDCGNTC